MLCWPSMFRKLLIDIFIVESLCFWNLRCFKVWITCTPSVKSSTQTLSQKTFSWTWMSCMSGVWLQKLLSGRKQALPLHLGQQVQQFCLLTHTRKRAYCTASVSFKWLCVNFSPVVFFLTSSHSLRNATRWLAFLPFSILFLKWVYFASCHYETMTCWFLSSSEHCPST